jgi:hypothetical protein
LFVNLPYPKKQNLHDLKETKEDKKNKYSCLPSNNDDVAINGNHIIEELPGTGFLSYFRDITKATVVKMNGKHYCYLII